MKIMKTLLILFVFAGTFFLSSCGSKGGHSHESVELQGQEYTSDYVCPMHCEGSGSEEAGTCPVCGMDYVTLEDHQADGHKHEDHSGHNH